MAGTPGHGAARREATGPRHGATPAPSAGQPHFGGAPSAGPNHGHVGTAPSAGPNHGHVGTAPSAGPYRHFGTAPLDPPENGCDAVMIPSRDVFADPPALVVREDVLAQIGGPEPVRAGALADLVARLERAGNAPHERAPLERPRHATLAALYREGSARFWLFRRHPDRFPLPRPSAVGLVRYPWLAAGALRANGYPRRRLE